MSAEEEQLAAVKAQMAVIDRAEEGQEEAENVYKNYIINLCLQQFSYISISISISLY